MRTETHELDLDPLLNAMNVTMKNGLNALLSDTLGKYKLYEQTHINLQSILHNLNVAPQTNTETLENEFRSFVKSNNAVTEKLLAQIETLRAEVQTLRLSAIVEKEKENIILIIEDYQGTDIKEVKEDSEEEESEEEESEEEESEKEESEEEEKEEEDESGEEEKEKEKEEEEEYFEVEINNVSYCTNNEVSGFIYGLDEEGGVGNKLGYMKDSEPFFYLHI
jgi:hypothetical protein